MQQMTKPNLNKKIHNAQMWFQRALCKGLDGSYDEHKLNQTYMKSGDMHSRKLQKKNN